MGGCAPCGGAEAAREGSDTPLANALRESGLTGDLSLGGRWLTLAGDRFRVFVVESARGGYFTWCDDPSERTVVFHRDARAAIEAGLARAVDARPPGDASSEPHVGGDRPAMTDQTDRPETTP